MELQKRLSAATLVLGGALNIGCVDHAIDTTAEETNSNVEKLLRHLGNGGSIINFIPKRRYYYDMCTQDNSTFLQGESGELYINCKGAIARSLSNFEAINGVSHNASTTFICPKGKDGNKIVTPETFFSGSVGGKDYLFELPSEVGDESRGQVFLASECERAEIIKKSITSPQ